MLLLQYDYKMNRNAEVRVGGIAAQATAQNNKSFSNMKLNKLALLVVRKVVQSKRVEVRAALKEAKDAADDRKLFLRNTKADAKNLRDRANHARRIIEWAVEPHHTAAFIQQNPTLVDPEHKSIEEELRGAPAWKREEVLKQNYFAFTSGWNYTAGICCFSGKSKCQMCNCSCGEKSAFKEGNHMEVPVLPTASLFLITTSDPLPPVYFSMLLLLAEACHQDDRDVGGWEDRQASRTSPA
jgi:hypothetical protein